MSAMRRMLSLAVLCCLLPGAAAAADDPLRLELVVGGVAERLHSPVADSLGLSLTSGPYAELRYDFRVFDVPMAGSDRPALHVDGVAHLGRRAIPVGEFAGPGFAGDPIQEVPSAQVLAGIEFRVPMTLVDPGAGSALVLGYRGGLILTGGGNNDFPHVKQFVFGFERTRGFLEGSRVEMAYGTNETAGRDHGSKRWATNVRLQGRLGPVHTVAAKPGAKPAAAPPAGPLHVFLEMEVDTDGSVGPDVLSARAGMTLNAGRVLATLLGADL